MTNMIKITQGTQKGRTMRAPRCPGTRPVLPPAHQTQPGGVQAHHPPPRCSPAPQKPGLPAHVCIVGGGVWMCVMLHRSPYAEAHMSAAYVCATVRGDEMSTKLCHLVNGMLGDRQRND